MEQTFVQGLSEQSRYFRFMGTMRELTPAMLVRFTQIDYDREMAFVALKTGDSGIVEIAVARYVTNADGQSCEFAIVIDDAWQRRGLGRVMMQRLIEVARQRGLATMTGHILTANKKMLALCAELGFVIARNPEDASTRNVTLTLAAA